MLPVGPASPFISNQAQLAGLQVEAGYVVTEVLLAHVVDLASAGGLVFHDDAHRRHLGFGVRAQPPHIQGFALRMRQDERARQPLDALHRHLARHHGEDQSRTGRVPSTGGASLG